MPINLDEEISALRASREREDMAKLTRASGSGSRLFAALAKPRHLPSPCAAPVLGTPALGVVGGRCSAVAVAKETQEISAFSIKADLPHRRC